MKEILGDIKDKIQSEAYKNEEHIRLSLTARVLQALGWNIWDPNEVNCEFNVVPTEDSTRVDIALLSSRRKPYVLIEVKALGKIMSGLEEAERQLRDYNRDNTALFSLITDGQIWRFYLSQTGGKFSDKCFKVVDLLEDDLDDAGTSFQKFLSKKEIENGNASKEAQTYLQLTEKQRIMEDLLPQAKRIVLEPPYPSLPNALIKLMADEGYPISLKDAEDFIKQVGTKPPIAPQPPIKPSRTAMDDEYIDSFSPDQPPNLHFTKIIEATLGLDSANKWNGLLGLAVKMALKREFSLNEIQNMSVPVQNGNITSNGFRPIPGTKVSLQSVDASKAWNLSYSLAKVMDMEIRVHFIWRDKEESAYPGKEGYLSWSPNQ